MWYVYCVVTDTLNYNDIDVSLLSRFSVIGLGLIGIDV